MWRSRYHRDVCRVAAGWLVAGFVLITFAAVNADDHWAFQPLSQPAVPQVKDKTRILTDIDSFILSRLEERGLGLSPAAEPHALVRRVYFDSVGLPPSPEEIDAFVKDPSPQAYERLIDQLLASPHFGERWGRQWLDNAGYTDVYGGDNDAAIIKQGENKWLYRDYVIRSLNADKPFDRFLTEQIAGDELVDWRSAEKFTPEIEELLIATGFLRNSADDTNENELNTLDIRYGVVHRTIEGIASNLLGLTLNCAKCHDHKYEPLTQRDYYQLQAILQPALNPDNWLQPQQRQLPALSPSEKKTAEKQNADLDREIGELRKRIAGVRESYEQKLLETKLAAVPEVIRADVKAALATEAEKRSEVQKYLVEKLQPQLHIKPDEVTAALSDADKASIETAEREINGLAAKKRSWQNWQVVYDVGPPTPTRILTRGNHLTPAAEVPPGTIGILTAAENAAFQPQPFGGSSGRRQALAKWLTDTKTPAGALVIRVRVNRIWQQLFGRGIVETSENFGVTGVMATHPELLDWLASDFVAGGQRLKPFVKKIMLSSVYRQASWVSECEGVRVGGSPEADSRTPAHPQTRIPTVAEAVDPENKLLWKQRLRRLESEAVRDAILAVSGKLDRTLGGAPIPVEPRPDGSFVVKQDGLPTPTSQFRRSIYLLSRRNYHPTLLAVFDQPHLTTNCTHREASAVVLQSLTMLNDQFVVEQADAVAARVLDHARSPEQRVPQAFKLALGRSPKEAETAWCRELLEKEAAFHKQGDKGCPLDEADRRALARLCHTLLNTSEFLCIP
ncbi:MAG TPA: DUF1549 and DUF1553 domain-containing protein [Pirellulaceae bacterium]|nr:DUF1549 and DUF1553 domain-containing protein [Pirellulaceae bacterium]